MARAVRRRESPPTFSLDLPAEVVDMLGPTPSKAAEYLKALALIELFRRGEVSSGYAAEVLAMRRWDFIQLLGKHGVPYFDATEEELRQQMEAAMPRQQPPSSPLFPTPAP